MKILLDECLPRKLKRSIQGHNCMTVPEAGFAGRKNGMLLSLAESSGFDIFLTIDEGLEYQQNLDKRKIAIIMIRAKSNRLADVLPHLPACLSLLSTIRAGQFARVGD